MSTTPIIEARPPQHRRVKRLLAVVSFLVALYPPLVVGASALLLPLAHQQDVQICTTKTFAGITKQSCQIHNASPLFGVVSVLTFLIFPAILATLVSGHLALYHLLAADGAKSQRIFAIIGLVLGYTWAAFALFVLASLSGAE